jgi:hypothetical protein
VVVAAGLTTTSARMDARLTTGGADPREEGLGRNRRATAGSA